MQPRSGSATEFVLQTLREHDDRELQVRDLAELAQGRFQAANISQSLNALTEAGAVVKTKEGREVWWAIAPARLTAGEPVGRSSAVEVQVIASDEPHVVEQPQPDPELEPQPEPQPEPAPEPERQPPPPVEAAPVGPAPIAKKPAPQVAVHFAQEQSPAVPRRPTRLVGPATARLQREAWAMLDALQTPAAADLVDLIHRVNPTGRGLEAADRAERYDVKHRLQSLLVRRHSGHLIVEVDRADPRVVGLRHQRIRLDACHAVVDDLDDDARSWVQFRIDTAMAEEVVALAPVSAPPVAVRREERGAEGWLPIAAAHAADYDYEAARDAYIQAFEESGGSVGTALPLVELLVETLGDFAGALALLPRIHPRGPGVVNLHSLLAIAAVHERQFELAERLLGDAVGPLPSRAWTQLAQASLAAGQWERGSRAVGAARRAGAVSPELLAAERRLATERERLRAPAEQALQALWAAGDMQAVSNEANAVLVHHPDSAAARRLLRDAERTLRHRRNHAVLQQAQDHAVAADWQAVLNDLGAVPASDWDDPMRVLHGEARSRQRGVQRQRALAEALQPFEQGDSALGLRAWWGLEDAELRAAVERACPSPCFDWLREMAAGGRRIDESVAAALALLELLGQPGATQAEALLTAFQRHPALRFVTRASKLADAFAQVGSAARREEQRRALDAVQALVAGEHWREAGAALADIDVPGGPLAARREALATAISQGLAADAAVERCKTLQESGNQLEAAHAAGVAASRHPQLDRATEWREKAQTLREAALRTWRFAVEETPHGAPNLLPLGICTRPEHVGQRINGAGQVVLSSFDAGIVYVEVLDPVTSRVVRRGMVDTGDRVQPWLDQGEGDVLVLTSGTGRCVFVDAMTLLPTRDFQAPLPDGHDCHRVAMPQPDLLWMLTSAGGLVDLAWRIVDLETVRLVGTCGHGQTDLVVACGLEPPGVFVQGDATGPQFLTPRGRPHGLSALLPGVAGCAAVVMPFDRHVACIFGDVPEKEARKPAIVPVRRPGSTGPKPHVTWATSVIVKWHCATAAFERGELLALGVAADNNLHVLVARPTTYAHVDLKVNRISNNCALVGSRDGQKGYLLAGLTTGLRVFADALALGAMAGKLLVRPVFPVRMPGYVQDKIENQAPGSELLGRVRRSRDRLDPAELDRLWDACGQDRLRLQVFGKLVHDQALSAAETLRSKVEQLAATSPGAAQHLVALDCAQDRFDVALAGWLAIDPASLDADEARHHQHLRGYLAIMQGDLDDGIERLDQVLAAEPEFQCGCAVKYWCDVAAAMRDRAAGKTEQPLSELLGAVASSESAIEDGRCVEVRATLAKYGLDGEPTAQSAARLALAWLRDPAERTADDRFQEVVALAVFLAVSDRTGRSHCDHLLLPGHHWPRARIEALAVEAAVRHAEILAGYFGAR